MYNRTYKNSFPSQVNLNYETDMKAMFSTDNLEINDATRRPSLFEIQRYSDTAFSAIPIFNNTNPIVTNSEVEGLGYRVLVFNPPLPATTRLFKYYAKGKFTQAGAGADAKSNTH